VIAALTGDSSRMAMNYLDELKAFCRLHIRSQKGAAALEGVLARIESEHREGPGGWAFEWSAQAAKYERVGRSLDAIQCYNFARFPFVNSPARAGAHAACVRHFFRWARSRDPEVARVDIAVAHQQVPIYTLAGGRSRPLLLAMGGIVSIKEQWHRLLFGAKRLGFSAAIAEFPGVGENPLPFTAECHGFIGAVLDSLHDVADTSRTYIVGLSFGGYLAIKQALRDSRIRGVTTVGAPLARFFTDADWWKQIPETTKKTLSHVCRVPQTQLFGYLNGFALDAAELKRLSIPVNYIFSLRDEIVPLSEKQILVDNIRLLNLKVYDDVHGAANHLAEVQRYIPWSVLSQSGARRSAAGVLLSAGLELARLKRRIKETRVFGF
jgi:esterase FrsA